MIRMISRGELFKASDNWLVVRAAENFKFKRKIMAEVKAEKSSLAGGASLLLLIGLEDEAGSPVEGLVIVPVVLEAGPKAAGEELIFSGEKDGEVVGGEGNWKREMRSGIKGEEIVVRTKNSLEEMGLGKSGIKNFKPGKHDSRHPGYKNSDLENSGLDKSDFEEPAGKEMTLEKKDFQEPGLSLIDVFAKGNGAYYSVFALSRDRIYEIYSDGACRGNPGPGGYAAIVLENGEVLEEISGSREETTNNRMELLAVIEGLESLNAGSKVRIYTDSSYVLRGMEEWLENWKNNGWITSAGKPVKNQDLWKRIAELQKKYRIELTKVKGHSGDKMNSRADQLAKEACQKAWKDGP